MRPRFTRAYPHIHLAPPSTHPPSTPVGRRRVPLPPPPPRRRRPTACDSRSGAHPTPSAAATWLSPSLRRWAHRSPAEAAGWGSRLWRGTRGAAQRGVSFRCGWRLEVRCARRVGQRGERGLGASAAAPLSPSPAVVAVLPLAQSPRPSIYTPHLTHPHTRRLPSVGGECGGSYQPDLGLMMVHLVGPTTATIVYRVLDDDSAWDRGVGGADEALSGKIYVQRRSTMAACCRGAKPFLPCFPPVHIYPSATPHPSLTSPSNTPLHLPLCAAMAVSITEVPRPPPSVGPGGSAGAAQRAKASEATLQYGFMFRVREGGEGEGEGRALMG